MLLLMCANPFFVCFHGFSLQVWTEGRVLFGVSVAVSFCLVANLFTFMDSVLHLLLHEWLGTVLQLQCRLCFRYGLCYVKL